jgi:hypothetical protein
MNIKLTSRGELPSLLKRLFMSCGTNFFKFPKSPGLVSMEKGEKIIMCSALKGGNEYD